MASSLSYLLVFLSLPFLVSAQPTRATSILEKSGEFSTVLSLLKAMNLDEAISSRLKISDEGLSLFVPTDKAFSEFPGFSLNFLSPQEKTQLLLLHVLGKYYSLETLSSSGNPLLPLAPGLTLNITRENTTQVLVSSDMATSRVTSVVYAKYPLAVYAVDAVLFPRAMVFFKAAAKFTFLFKLLKAKRLFKVILGLYERAEEGVALFAPTDEAFERLSGGGFLESLTLKEVTELLGLHVVPKYTSFKILENERDPLQTLAHGLTLNVTSKRDRVFVSSGLVTTPVVSAFYDSHPLAIYRIEEVLIPKTIMEGDSGGADSEMSIVAD